MQTFQWKKDFGLFFLILSKITKVKELFLRDHKVCLPFFAIDKSLSLGPKRSIARFFSKISCSHGDKRFWLTFLKNINCDKSTGTVCKCSKGFLTITMEVIRSFLQHMRGCWKHNFLKKKGNLPSEEKNYGPLFLVFSSVTNLKGGFVRVFKVFSSFLCW